MTKLFVVRKPDSRVLSATSSPVLKSSSTINKHDNLATLIHEVRTIAKVTQALNKFMEALSCKAADAVLTSNLVAKEFELLFSKELKRSLIQPATKTVEEEFVQGYLFTLSNVTNSTAPSIRRYTALARRVCTMMEKMIKNIEFAIVKRELFALEIELCLRCPAHKGLSGTVFLGENHQMQAKLTRIEDALRKELPVFIELAEQLFDVLVGELIERQFSTTEIATENLVNYLKVWGIEPNDDFASFSSQPREMSQVLFHFNSFE